MRTYATFAKSLRAVLQTAIAFLFTVLTTDLGKNIWLV
jgi:hypothetical protein